MARENNSPYADWREINLPGCVWNSGAGFSLPPAAALTADQLTGQLNGGGETPKVTISLANGFYTTASRTAAYYYTLPIPDFVFDKQPGRFPAWDGLTATPMDLDGTLMRAIQFENVIVGGTGQGGVQAADLTLFDAFVKFRGFGSNIDASTPSQDQVIHGLGEFGDMALPSVAPGEQNDAVTFADPEALSIARIRTLVLIPFTCAMGDQLECAFSFVFSAQEAASFQWYQARYRWIDGFSGPLPQAPNTSVQLLGQDAAGYLQNFGQSRLDDLPYEP